MSFSSCPTRALRRWLRLTHSCWPVWPGRYVSGHARKSEGRNVLQLSRGRKPHHSSARGEVMFAIIGIAVVFAAVIGGFLMEKGHILVLVQPAELLILVGAAMSTLLVAKPLHIIKGIVAGLMGVLKGSSFGKPRYLSTLKMMCQFLNKVRKEGDRKSTR